MADLFSPGRAQELKDQSDNRTTAPAPSFKEGGSSADRSTGKGELTSTIPITIKMLEDTPPGVDNKPTINDKPVVNVKVVGRVVSVNKQPTHLSLQLSDTTGTIEMLQFMSGDADEDAAVYVPEVQALVSLIATVRRVKGQWVLVPVSCKPSPNDNEVTYHCLEVMTAAARAAKGPLPDIRAAENFAAKTAAAEAGAMKPAGELREEVDQCVRRYGQISKKDLIGELSSFGFTAGKIARELADLVREGIIDEPEQDVYSATA